jgi:hypothetical protein
MLPLKNDFNRKFNTNEDNQSQVDTDGISDSQRQLRSRRSAILFPKNNHFLEAIRMSRLSSFRLNDSSKLKRNSLTL